MGASLADFSLQIGNKQERQESREEIILQGD
jgi:hypothetical protein